MAPEIRIIITVRYIFQQTQCSIHTYILGTFMFSFIQHFTYYKSCTYIYIYIYKHIHVKKLNTDWVLQVYNIFWTSIGAVHVTPMSFPAQNFARQPC
jgi:hypothetical protein